MDCERVDKIILESIKRKPRKYRELLEKVEKGFKHRPKTKKEEIEETVKKSLDYFEKKGFLQRTPSDEFLFAEDDDDFDQDFNIHPMRPSKDHEISFILDATQGEIIYDPAMIDKDVKIKKIVKVNGNDDRQKKVTETVGTKASQILQKKVNAKSECRKKSESSPKKQINMNIQINYEQNKKDKPKGLKNVVTRCKIQANSPNVEKRKSPDKPKNKEEPMKCLDAGLLNYRKDLHENMGIMNMNTVPFSLSPQNEFYEHQDHIPVPNQLALNFATAAIGPIDSPKYQFSSSIAKAATPGIEHQDTMISAQEECFERTIQEVLGSDITKQILQPSNNQTTAVESKPPLNQALALMPPEAQVLTTKDNIQEDHNRNGGSNLGHGYRFMQIFKNFKFNFP